MNWTRSIFPITHRHYSIASKLTDFVSTQLQHLTSLRSNGFQRDEHQQGDLPLYENHIPISPLQRAILAVGSSVIALTDPARGDMVAVNGEASGQFALEKMYRSMQSDPEGQQILTERPRINSKTINFKNLEVLPDGTLGREYKVSPDTRLAVRFVDDPDLAYVMQRYRETHDLVHTLLGMPTNMLGEVAVKWVEGMQTGLPMCVGGAIFGPIRLKPKNRATYLKEYLPWAIRVGSTARPLMNVYYEQRWEQSIQELRDELQIETPPVL